MDKILLNQKLVDWNKACRYFASTDILAQLSNEEKQAVAFLTTFWRDQEFNPAACEKHITALKSADKLHSSNREIIEHSKMLRGIAQTFYTKDAATFNIFRSALENKQTPTTEGVPRHNNVMMMGWVEKWAKAMQYLKSAEIVALLEQSELTAIEQLGDMWRRPKYSPDMKREAEEYIATLTASHKYHASNRDVIDQSKNLCHVARNVYANEDAFNTFKRVLTKYNSEHKPPHREHIPTPTPKPNPTPNSRRDTVLKITNVLFGGSNHEGKIIVPFGSTIYNSVQYITPKLIVGSEYYGTHEIEFSLHSSDGSHGTYTDTVTFNGKGEYITSGWGAESGTTYRDCSYVDYTIRINHRVVWECRVDIVRDKSLPTVPTISKVLFAATDYDGNIMMEPSDSLPTGILYLTPYITISNNFVGTVDLVIRIRRGDGRTSEYETTLWVNGASNYRLSGWGNKEGTSYLDADTITVDIIHKGKVLNSSKVRITASARKYRRDQNQSSGDSSWKKFNNKIKRIGDWFASEKANDTIIGILSMGLSIVYIASIILTWKEDGFWDALLVGVLGLFVLGIVVTVAVFSVKIFQWVFRAIFYNVWTLFIALAFIISPLFTTPFIKDLLDESFQNRTKVEPIKTVISTTTYYCTSKSGLKVRNSPSVNASQLGSLTYGEAVEVIDITGEFAKIKYEHANGQEAWVSSKYITTTKPTQTPPKSRAVETSKTDVVKITSVSFADTDYNRNIRTGYGKQLYSNVQYLTPKVTIKPLDSSLTCTFQVKIFRPDQTLFRGDTSPQGYTFNQELTIKSGTTALYFIGWGNSNGKAYPPGIYKYEIWCNGDRLYSTTVDIKSQAQGVG